METQRIESNQSLITSKSFNPISLPLSFSLSLFRLPSCHHLQAVMSVFNSVPKLSLTRAFLFFRNNNKIVPYYTPCTDRFLKHNKQKIIVRDRIDRRRCCIVSFWVLSPSLSRTFMLLTVLLRCFFFQLSHLFVYCFYSFDPIFSSRVLSPGNVNDMDASYRFLYPRRQSRHTQKQEREGFVYLFAPCPVDLLLIQTCCAYHPICTVQNKDKTKIRYRQYLDRSNAELCNYPVLRASSHC